MSRIGLEPIKIEEGATVNIEGKNINVSGPKGEQTVTLPDVLSVEVKDGQVFLTRTNEEKLTKSLHGTFRALVSNAINGVVKEFEKHLELVGVGYRAKMEGTTLVLSLGWNHPVKVEAPEGISFEVPDETKVVVKGIDKQRVGEMATKIRIFRKPEPYKGKGIRYAGEYVRRKSSKAGLGS
jgi:large subunit ribosomal protein L6